MNKSADSSDFARFIEGPGIRSRTQREALRLSQDLEVREAELERRSEELRRLREELETQRDRYFNLYELAPIGYATLDAQGRIVLANLSLAKLLGVERRRLVGTSLVQRMLPADRRRFSEFLQGVWRAGAETRGFEVTLHTASGARPVMLEVAPADVDGGSLRVAVADLSKLHLAQRSMREREERLRAVVDTVADGIVTVDANGRIESCNVAAARLFHASAAWLVGQSVQRVLPDFFEFKSGVRFELVARRGDGSEFPAEIAVTKPRRQEPSGLVAVISDISERKRGAAELEEVLLRFRQIADHIDDAIYVVDGQTLEPLYLSPAFETVYGRSASEAAAEAWPFAGWIHAEDREAVVAAIDEVRGRGGSLDLRYRVVHPDGTIRMIRNRAFVIEAQGRISGKFHDMTEELALQAELRQAQRLEAIGTLASGIAHDFNNLLMGVGGCAQLALRRLDPAHPSYSYLRRAADAILRGANLTRQILRFSDTRSTTDEPVELDAVLSGARELIHRLIGEQITLTVVTQAPGLSIAADPGDIEQVLLNLASNARDAMPDGGALVLETEPEQGGMVALTVTDTGAGMTEETKRRVFEPFFTTKEVGKGTGLGLSTVFSVVRRMGGSIAIDSAMGRGTRFTLRLPVVIASKDAEQSNPLATRGDGQCVLIVEDDPLIRLTVETHVQSLGYRGLTAASVADALKVLSVSSRPIDLVLTDVMMPGLLGSDLGRLLKQRTPELTVIYMSAHSRHELVEKGLVPENARLLAKPFDARDLGAALHEALTGKPASTPPPSTLRVFVVDDNPDLVDALSELLSVEGHEVGTAQTLTDALRKIPEFQPDIVLSDINLDDEMDGFTLVTRLRRDERLRKTVFLAVTGMAENRCRPAALAAGFEDVLTKPLDFPGLTKLLAARARR